MGSGIGRIFERPKASGNFWIAYYVRGQEYRESVRKALGTSRASRLDAVDLLKTRVGEQEAGRFLEPTARHVTVSDLVTAYVEHLELTGAKSLAPVRSTARHLHDHLGSMRVAELSAVAVQRWMTRCLADGDARGTVAQRAARLRAAISLARKQGRIAMEPHIPTLKVNNVRQGFLEPVDFTAFVTHLADPIDDIARFAYLTGWRRTEILTLQWTNVDFRAQEIRLGDTKNGDGRVIPMACHGRRLALADVLDKRWKMRALTPWVFHRTGKPVKRFDGLWSAAFRAAGLAPRRLHDFRRSAVRNLLNAGVSQRVAMMITGHRSAAVFARYDIRTLEDVAQGLQRMDRYLEVAR